MLLNLQQNNEINSGGIFEMFETKHTRSSNAREEHDAFKALKQPTPWARHISLFRCPA